MNNGDHLYYLVKSLDKHEKRFFKRYVKLHNPNKLPQYLHLFEVLDRMESFDKNQMATKLSKKVAGSNISQLKQYLKHNIFNALKVYDKKNSYTLQDNEDINTAKILIAKKLYGMAEKVLLKLRKEAKAQENSQLHLHTNTELVTIRVKQDQKDAKIINDISQFYEENLLCAKELKEKMQLLHIKAKASKLHYSKVRFGEKGNIFFKKILDEDLALFQSEEFLSQENSIIYYNLLFTINSILQRGKEALKAIEKAKKIIQSPVLKYYPNHVATLYVHLLYSYIYNENTAPFFSTLRDAQLLLDRNPSLKPTHQCILYSRELEFYFANADKKPQKQVFEKIIAFIENDKNDISLTDKNTLLKKMATYYFIEQNYGTCQDILLQITLEHSVSLDEFYFVEVNLMEIICYYEIGTLKIAKQKLEAFERKLNKSKVELNNLIAIVDIIKAIILSEKQEIAYFEQINNHIPPNDGIVINRTDLHALFVWVQKKIKAAKIKSS